jgi:hypothetical protein
MTVAHLKLLSRRSNDCRMATREFLHAPSELLDDSRQDRAPSPAHPA